MSENAPSQADAGPSAGKAAARPDGVRVMVVDDSLTARTVLGKIVDRADGMTPVGSASSAEQALSRMDALAPDVVLLDLEMPGMGGLAALPAILRRPAAPRVLVVSSLTARGGKVTVEALAMGAADAIQKPESGQFTAAYRADIAERIRTIAAGGKPSPDLPDRSAGSAYVLRDAPPVVPRCIAIGGSTGGIHSLTQFLAVLPPSYRVPILVTQHLPASFTAIFATQIAQAARRPAHVAARGMAMEPGAILIAPGDAHMRIVRQGPRMVVELSDEPTASGCRPSVDPMFSSLAASCNGAAIGVVLSGMGRDGSQGAADLAAAGGILLAECAETSAVWGMPRGIAEAGLASAIDAPAALAEFVLARQVVQA